MEPNALKHQRGRPKKRKLNTPGRPKKPIQDAARSTRYRRAHDIINAAEHDVSLLELALKIAKYSSNSSDNDEVASSEQVPHTKETVFAFYLEQGMTKQQYIELRKDNKKRGCNIYPAYEKIREAKKDCLLEQYEIMSETEIRVSFQNIANKTAERICEVLKDKNWLEEEWNSLTMQIAYGFDSSSGHDNPHQVYENEDNYSEQAQQSLFASTFILIGLKSDTSQKWLNPTPQSVRFCRPLRLAFEKETDASTLEEQQRLDSEVKQLQQHTFILSNEKHVSVKFEAHLTMIDGKVLNAVLGNQATQRCPLCHLTQREYSDLNNPCFVPETSLSYGLGLLHCIIKGLDQCLHLSYKLLFKVWDIRKAITDEYNERVKDIKKRVWNEFKVHVDQVLQGKGTTNTGNVARRCLSEPEKFARALQIDEVFVINLSSILLAYSSKKEINYDKMEELCEITYRTFYVKYPWARMSPTIHKLLKHSCAIGKKFNLPLAYYAEDAGESMHKEYRKQSIKHARQDSRKHRLLDVFNYSTYLSDP